MNISNMKLVPPLSFVLDSRRLIIDNNVGLFLSSRVRFRFDTDSSELNNAAWNHVPHRKRLSNYFTIDPGERKTNIF